MFVPIDPPIPVFVVYFTAIGAPEDGISLRWCKRCGEWNQVSWLSLLRLACGGCASRCSCSMPYGPHIGEHRVATTCINQMDSEVDRESSVIINIYHPLHSSEPLEYLKHHVGDHFSGPSSGCCGGGLRSIFMAKVKWSHGSSIVLQPPNIPIHIAHVPLPKRPFHIARPGE
jgi:hypothetical protein